jgi:hypothetical protein
MESISSWPEQRQKLKNVQRTTTAAVIANGNGNDVFDRIDAHAGNIEEVLRKKNISSVDWNNIKDEKVSQTQL